MLLSLDYVMSAFIGFWCAFTRLGVEIITLEWYMWYLVSPDVWYSFHSEMERTVMQQR